MKISKTTISKSKYFLLALLVAFSFSCSPEDGDDGATGPAGPAGTNGTDGNANVIVKTIVPDPGPNLTWTVGSYLGQTANEHSITDTDLTQNVLDNSMIVAYFQLFGNDIWYPMTYSYIYSGGGGEIITYTHSLNNLTVFAFSDTGALSAGITKLKYFIIPGTTASRNNVDFKNLSYNKMTEYFNLEY